MESSTLSDRDRLQVSSACHHSLLRVLLRAAHGILYRRIFSIHNLDLQLEILRRKWSPRLQNSTLEELVAVHVAFTKVSNNLLLSKDERARWIARGMLKMRSKLLQGLHIVAPTPWHPNYVSIEEIQAQYLEQIIRPSNGLVDANSSYDLFRLFIENEAIKQRAPRLLVDLLCQLVEDSHKRNFYEYSSYFEKLLQMIKEGDLPLVWGPKFWKCLLPRLEVIPAPKTPQAYLFQSIYRVYPELLQPKYFLEVKTSGHLWVRPFERMMAVALGDAWKEPTSPPLQEDGIKPNQASSLRNFRPCKNSHALVIIDYLLWLRGGRPLADLALKKELLAYVFNTLKHQSGYRKKSKIGSSLVVLFSKPLYNLLHFYLTNTWTADALNKIIVPHKVHNRNQYLYSLLRDHVSNVRVAAVALKLLGEEMEFESAPRADKQGSSSICTFLQEIYFASREIWTDGRRELALPVLVRRLKGSDLLELLQAVAYVFGDLPWEAGDDLDAEGLIHEWNYASTVHDELTIIMRVLERLMRLKDNQSRITVRWLPNQPLNG